MSCNCKNIIEVFQGGDVPLPTTFYSSVTLTQLCHTVAGTKDEGGTLGIDGELVLYGTDFV